MAPKHNQSYHLNNGQGGGGGGSDKNKQTTTTKGDNGITNFSKKNNKLLKASERGEEANVDVEALISDADANKNTANISCSSIVTMPQVDENDLAAEKMSSNRYSATKVFLLLSMSAALIALLAYVLISFVVIPLGHEPKSQFPAADEQSNQYSQGYQLFATKTTYTTAYNHLNKQPNTQSANSASPQLPSILTPSKSLRDIRDSLSAEGCKLKGFYFIGRHAARFPNSDSSGKINRAIAQIQSSIDLTNDDSCIGALADEPETGNKPICADPLAPFKNWRAGPLGQDVVDNQIMDTGANETVLLARRFKELYPNMFDNSVTQVEFHVTEAIRTAQTALLFMKELESFPLDFCNYENFPHDMDIVQRAGKIASDSCFDELIKKFKSETLSFHKTCDMLAGERQNNTEFSFKNPEYFKFIREHLTAKLKLKRPLTYEETDAIYEVCRYESALYGRPSIWCGLFEKEHLQFYEYKNDAEDYYNQAMGEEYQWKSSCSVRNNVIDFLGDIMYGDANQKDRAHFAFTHSQAIQKILAGTIELSDMEYSPEKLRDNLSNHIVPERREWRTSLISPFSSNIAFSLFHCPRRPRSRTTDNRYQLVVSLNEQPIKIAGCEDYVCPASILSTVRFSQPSNCDMEQICRKQTKYS